jgi:hypothetical protein
MQLAGLPRLQELASDCEGVSTDSERSALMKSFGQPLPSRDTWGNRAAAAKFALAPAAGTLFFSTVVK